jgi:hypothetical protein
MLAPSSYDYAVIRLVPSVERGECINVGVILYCRTRRFLGVLTQLDPQRVLTLAPDINLEAVREHLDTLMLISSGDPAIGSLSQLSQPERFHWLVSPRSTIIQISPVHSCLCTDPEAVLQRLLKTMVSVSSAQAISSRSEYR